jgi:hypothetical protein
MKDLTPLRSFVTPLRTVAIMKDLTPLRVVILMGDWRDSDRSHMMEETGALAGLVKVCSAQ